MFFVNMLVRGLGVQGMKSYTVETPDFEGLRWFRMDPSLSVAIASYRCRVTKFKIFRLNNDSGLDSKS